jgi:hypothetical protein
VSGYNYLEVDKGLAPLHYYPDLLNAAQKMGYASVSEAVIEGYQKYSIRRLGQKLERSKTGLCSIMDKLRIKRRSRGGANRVGARTYHGKPCKPHGATKRYVKGGACILCAIEANRRHRMNKGHR